VPLVSILAILTAAVLACIPGDFRSTPMPRRDRSAHPEQNGSPAQAPSSHMLCASDSFRRSFGAALDTLGLGPREAAWRPVLTDAGFVLRRYGETPPDAVPVLIVPAPIKRPYIFDLLPPVSVVQRLLAAGLATYLLAWREPGAGSRDWGLGEYAGSWIAAALDQIGREHARKPILVGHSIGGTLAAMFAALERERVGKLLLIEAPLRFGAHAGALSSVVTMSPRVWPVAESVQHAPGTLLDAASVTAAPEEFVIGRWCDALASLLDPELAAIHARVVRWTFDEFAQPARLFAEIVELLYREDRFARGELRLGGRTVLPAALAGLPVAAIVDRTSRLVPPESALGPLSSAVVFAYEPELGVALQHVGPLVGRRAHRDLWPPVTRWMSELP